MIQISLKVDYYFSLCTHLHWKTFFAQLIMKPAGSNLAADNLSQKYTFTQTCQTAAEDTTMRKKQRWILREFVVIIETFAFVV
jgi:hypothetical protein